LNFLERNFFPVLILLLVSGPSLRGQNLAPNPSFEINTNCPAGINIIMDLPCDPWTPATTGTSDYFHTCAPMSSVGIPENYFGHQFAFSGNAYCGFFTRENTPPGDYREYIQSPLISPLVAGVTYYVSFYVSLADNYCGTEHIGAYFSNGTPPFNMALPLTNIPQVESNTGFLTDTANWMLVEGCFDAEGGENYVTIGNFHTNAGTPVDQNCTYANWISSYYYIDEIYIAEIHPVNLDLNLDGPVYACYEYTIDPGLTDVHYHWEDGSTGSTLTVYTSGTYSVTVSANCEVGVDSIEVVITNAPPLELNPDDSTLCAGESITFSFDPTIGEYLWQDGSDAFEYTITTSGFYEVTFDDGCDISIDDISVTFVDPPSPFSLGPDTILCSGTDIVLFFDEDLGAFHWHNGSVDNSFIINSPGLYALTISNMCGEFNDELEVVEVIPPIVDLGLNNLLLCNGESFDIHLDTAMGTYFWQDGTTSPDYHITQPGEYAVTLTSVCGESSDFVIVQIMNSPSFNLGDTLSGCPGDTFLLSVPGALGNYTWQDGSTNDSLIVTASGAYALTIENVCGVGSDSIEVTYENDLFQPVLGDTIILCPGEQAILSAGNPGGNIVWQDFNTSDTFLVSAPGIYSVIVSNQCLLYTDSVEVLFQNNAPVITLPDQLSLCQGNTAILDPGLSGVTFLWNDGTNNPTLTITGPGDYSLTVNNACGSDVDTVIVMDGGGTPFVTLGSDVSICPGDTFDLIPVFSDVDTWTWSDGSTSAFYTVSDSGLVDVVVSNSCGVDYDTIHIHLLDAAPDLDLGADTSLCAGQSVTLSVLIPNVNIVWSDGSSTSSLIVDTPGSYHAMISNACGNASDTVDIGFLPGIPDIDLGPDLPLCPGEEITLTPYVTDVDYLWQDGSTDTFFLADQDQTIMLTISNACGTSSDTVIIFSSTVGPDVNLGTDILACEGESVTIVSNITGVDFLWQDGSGGPSFTTTTSGMFYLQVSNSCGTDSDTILVDIHGTVPTPDLGPDSSLCEGTTLTLLSSADVETTNTWQDGSTASSFLVINPGVYVLTLTNHCGENSDSVLISYQALPVGVDLGPDTVLCKTETLILNAPTTSDQIEWQDGSVQTSFLATQEGIYSLTITNECGMTTDEIEISFEDQTLKFPLEDVFEICPAESVLLDVTQSFDVTYLWSTGATSSSISVITPGEYAVTIKSICQEATQVIEVIPSEECDPVNEFYIPNVISPNGDDINDIFTIFPGDGLEFISMEGSIFDRWGDLVFSSKENPFTWDGNFGDQKVMPGVYVYKLELKYLLNGGEISELLVGDVTVIR